MALYRPRLRDTQPLDAARRRHRARRDRMRDGHRRSSPAIACSCSSFGRFGQLMSEIARRAGADVQVVEAAWGTVFRPEQVEAALARFSPKLVAVCQGDTSTTMAQPLDELGALCRQHGAMLQVDATATLGGMPLPVDAWQIDCVTGGLQKCLGGPVGIGTDHDQRPDGGSRLSPPPYRGGAARRRTTCPATGPIVGSNYFDLAMLIDYWSDLGLNHHTEATSMLYAARECARIFLKEGRERAFRRHALAGRALVAGIDAMGLEGLRRSRAQDAERDRRVDSRKVSRASGCARRCSPISTSRSARRSVRCTGKIWRIGTMGVNARKDAVLVDARRARGGAGRRALQAAARRRGRRRARGISRSAGMMIDASLRGTARGAGVGECPIPARRACR